MSEHTDVDHPRAPSALASRCPCGDRNRNGWIATGPACLRASGRTDRRSAADGVSAGIAVSNRASTDTTRAMNVATVSCSVAATLRLVAPVAKHRLKFRHHRLGIAVSAAHRLAYAGLVLLGVALLGGDGRCLRGCPRSYTGDAGGWRRTGEFCDVVDGSTAMHTSGRDTGRVTRVRRSTGAAPYSQPIPLRTSATTGGISPTTRLAVLTIPPVHPSQGAPGERRSSADAWW